MRASTVFIAAWREILLEHGEIDGPAIGVVRPPRIVHVLEKKIYHDFSWKIHHDFINKDPWDFCTRSPKTFVNGKIYIQNFLIELLPIVWIYLTWYQLI